MNVSNSGLITSYGDHAAGVQAQSIGGGGGKGGAAVSFNVGSVIPTASVAVGGRGGGGGAGGNVSVTNTGQVTTYGADAYGVNIHSIGGGGGNGGIAAARAVNISGDPEIPAISLSASIGGKGGSGNTAGTVGLVNSGLITTAGDGAIGVMAQSIGGGGGNGGDSTAASYSAGPQDGVAISLAVAVGGAGGTGGTGGAVTINNKGLVATLGQDAFGVFAQSVGGGGGMGGAGDASASAQNAKSSFGAALAIGGNGRDGRSCGRCRLDQQWGHHHAGRRGRCGVRTERWRGWRCCGRRRRHRKWRQAEHRGRGWRQRRRGRRRQHRNSHEQRQHRYARHQLHRDLSPEHRRRRRQGRQGRRDSGRDQSRVERKIPVQHIGGRPELRSNCHGPWRWRSPNRTDRPGNTGNIRRAERHLLAAPGRPAQNIGNSVNINVAVSVGGKGGAAGNGGAANATNTGSIATYGAQSDGIYAQSVGGGGGSGGAASSTDKAANDTPVQASLAVGGQGGAGGAGGAVTVTNGRAARF